MFNLVMDIHERIKRARLDKGMSMEQLAAALGLRSWQTIQQWENRKTAPSRKRLPDVARALGMTEEELTLGYRASKDWPFKRMDERRVRTMDSEDLARIEMLFLIEAEKYGFHLATEVIEQKKA